LDIWLTSPDGETVILLSDARNHDDFDETTLIFDQSAASVLGVFGLDSDVASGSYRPVNYDPYQDDYAFPSASSTNLDDFNGGSANGDWNLNIADDASGDVGNFVSWSLRITTARSQISINDVSVTEGGSGTAAMMTFTVTRSGDTSGSSTISYATANDSATTADGDYTAATGSITFNATETTKTIQVGVNGDDIAEANETFFVNLTSTDPLVSFTDNQGEGTIINDEAAPGLSVADVTVAEDAVHGEFTVTLSPTSGDEVTVGYIISDGTAIHNTDYMAPNMSGTLTFTAGTTTQTVPFTISDNTLLDGNRTFNITLGKSGNTPITDDEATATIIDDEQPAPVTPAAVEVAGPPPATACTDVNFEDPGIIRTAFENDADRAALSCRLLASGGGYLSWLGSPLTSSANVGNQTVLDLGVVAAVDIAGPGGFQGGVAICLQGSGHMIYLDASEAPRIPRLWSTWTTPSFPGYTCTTIYAPGTVVLVANPPR
jgi:subtilisin-like proprotein convertase family protein